MAGSTPPSEGTIAFTGGGTGGHIYPGLAVIEELKRQGFKGRIVWIGSHKELDRKIVEAAGVEYIPIASGKLRRSLSLRNIADGFRVLAGYAQSLRCMDRLHPDLLFSKGGYVSVPPCRAAAKRSVPFFTHESDASPGLATRLNSGRAEKIFVSWPSTAQMLPAPLKEKAVVTGNPVRSSLFEGSAQKGRALMGVPPGLPVVTFLGGSQGSRQLNDLAEALKLILGRNAFIFHQTGAELFDASRHAPIEGAYKAVPYVGSEIIDILAASDVIVGRAGAGTVWECAALGKPMVLIPLSGSGTRGDQVENAAKAAQAGAAVSLVGEEATPEAVFQAVSRFLEDDEARKAAGAAGLSLTRIADAAGKPTPSAAFIATLLLERMRMNTGGLA